MKYLSEEPDKWCGGQAGSQVSRGQLSVTLSSEWAAMVWSWIWAPRQHAPCLGAGRLPSFGFMAPFSTNSSLIQREEKALFFQCPLCVKYFVHIMQLHFAATVQSKLIPFF